MRDLEPVRKEPLPKPSTKVDRFYLLVVTSGGLGLSPFVPGTVGTLGGVAIFALLAALSFVKIWLLLLLSLFFTLLCGFMGPWMESYFGHSDPKPVVIDEVAGYLLSVIVFFPGEPWLVGILAFFAFRFFDILKPYPISKLEKLPRGWGVAFDDIGAGILAALVVNGALYFFF